MLQIIFLVLLVFIDNNNNKNAAAAAASTTFSHTADSGDAAATELQIKPTPVQKVVEPIHNMTNYEVHERRNSKRSPTIIRKNLRRSTSDDNDDEECNFITCCSNYGHCRPSDCFINARVCAYFRQRGLLANLGRPVISEDAFSPPVMPTFGNIRLVNKPAPITKILKAAGDDDASSTEAGFFASKFGTITFSANAVNSRTLARIKTAGAETIVISKEPHLVATITLLETLLHNKIITHYPLVPDNAENELSARLACGGPVTLLERVGVSAAGAGGARRGVGGRRPASQQHKTIWTTITPHDTARMTRKAENCAQFVTATNFYANAVNFRATPPAPRLLPRTPKHTAQHFQQYRQT